MEKDLFDPIKSYFEAQGFSCDGEVLDIDLYMERGEETAAVELKEKLDFRAVQQAALRQKTVDTVYIGIFMPKNIYSRSFKDRLYLLKRLGIGLLGVSKRTGIVSVISEAVVSELDSFRRRNRKQRAAEAEEFHKRTLRSNTGGVHAEKLMTGYRENALLVLAAMLKLERDIDRGGPAEGHVDSGIKTRGEAVREGINVRLIRERSGVSNATAILYDNHYGWFTHVGRGVYRVSEQGRKAAEEFGEAISMLQQI